MLIGALLVVAWFVLLIRYPLRALPISLGALAGLGLVAAWVLWQEHRENQLLARLEMRMNYSPTSCPAERPLQVQLRNLSDKPLQSLRWDITAFTPGSQLDLVTSAFESPRYQGPGDLQPGQNWQTCLPTPPLRPGYRASSLEFRAERLQGKFAD